MKVFYDKDADLSLIKDRKVTILGYGSQGHAHALNLKDSGVKVIVALRKGGASWDKAKNAGLQVKEVGDAVKGADIVMVLLPDEHHAQVYRESIEPNSRRAARSPSRTASTSTTARSNPAPTSTSGWSRRRGPATPFARPMPRAAACRC